MVDPEYGTYFMPTSLAPRTLKGFLDFLGNLYTPVCVYTHTHIHPVN